MLEVWGWAAYLCTLTSAGLVGIESSRNIHVPTELSKSIPFDPRKKNWNVQGTWSILQRIIFCMDQIHPSWKVNLGKISEMYPGLSCGDKGTGGKTSQSGLSHHSINSKDGYLCKMSRRSLTSSLSWQDLFISARCLSALEFYIHDDWTCNQASRFYWSVLF